MSSRQFAKKLGAIRPAIKSRVSVECGPRGELTERSRCGKLMASLAGSCSHFPGEKFLLPIESPTGIELAVEPWKTSAVCCVFVFFFQPQKAPGQVATASKCTRALLLPERGMHGARKKFSSKAAPSKKKLFNFNLDKSSFLKAIS